MQDMKNARSRAGYDQEEAYFFERNRELIEKQRGVKPKLLLLQGGKSNLIAEAGPPGQPSRKKAA